jgi:hypothetical protein
MEAVDSEEPIRDTEKAFLDAKDVFTITVVEL